MKKMVWRRTGIAALCLLCVMLLSSCAALEQQRAYKEASASFTEENYAAAAESFAAAENYKDAVVMASLSRMFAALDEGDYAGAAEISGTLTERKIEDATLAAAVDEMYAKYFQEAKRLFEEKRYQAAADTFLCVGEYDDAAKMASYCKAFALIENEEFAEAADILEGLGDFEKAAGMSVLCRNYLRAVDLYNSENEEALPEAVELFDSLRSFGRAAVYAQEGKHLLALRQAATLAEDGKYAEAHEILSQESDSEDEQWQELLRTCENEMRYAEAEQLYADGLFYKAYQKFSALGSFRDAAERSENCRQSMPDNGVVYRNPDYQGKNVSFTIDNSGFMNTYIKLYNPNDELILTVFIRNNEKASFKLPSGTYHMNQGYGEEWYGTEDMFGANGYYWKCKVGGAYEFKLESGGSYVMSTGSGGDPVSNESIGSGDM